MISVGKQGISQATTKTQSCWQCGKAAAMPANGPKNGLATAESAFMWNKDLKVSTEPVDVNQNPDGSLELMNGYHRYVYAKKHGDKTIKAKVRIYGEQI